jgi:hypothetical protein
MRKRILAVTAATSLALGTLAGSALAHHNTAIPLEDQSVGPPTTAPGYLVGHSGMECGASVTENTPLVPLGLDCPAAVTP